MDKAAVARLEHRLSLVFARMTINEPFIAAVGTKMPRRIVPEGTAWASETELGFALSFCERWDDDKLFGLALHEVMHVVLMHMWRTEDRDPEMFNNACDAVINRYIKSKNYALPDGGILYSWVTDDMDAETVYQKLMRDKPPSEGGSGQPSPAGNGEGSGDGQGEDTQPGGADAQGKGSWEGKGDLRKATDKAQEADIRASIMTAAKMAKACGDNSLLVRRILDGGLTPKVAWADEILADLTSTSRDDFSYRRVNRRMLASGIYLPAMHSDGMGGLVIGFDTSGSVGSAEADRIGAEIKGIAAMLNPTWIKVVYCDSEVQHVQHFDRGDEITLEVQGGGGTRFSPVFEYVDTLDEPVAALIYLSDLQGPFSDIDIPEYPVYWGNTYDDSKAPFGKTVRVRV